MAELVQTIGVEQCEREGMLQPVRLFNYISLASFFLLLSLFLSSCLSIGCVRACIFVYVMCMDCSVSVVVDISTLMLNRDHLITFTSDTAH